MWARALVFARLNDLPLSVHGWWAPSGIRRRDIRTYGYHIRSAREAPLFFRVRFSLRWEVVTEPEIEKIDSSNLPTIYEFRRVPHWSDYFEGIKGHRDLIRSELLRSVRPHVLHEVATLPSSPICVHVRCGDFAVLRPGQNFAEVGQHRTPIEYFVRVIKGIRDVGGKRIPVQVFTDGDASEVRELLALPAVSLAPRAPGMVDLLRMARASVIVASAGSTFGYWAGFLGECALLLHRDHVYKSIRSDDFNSLWYEGPFPQEQENWPGLLFKNLCEVAARS